MALFQPIDWKPTDFSGLAEIGTHIENLRKQRADERRAEENSAIQRQYAENQNRRTSADIARQEFEDRQKLEDRKQKEALDRWQALPAVLRLARQDPTMAAANPYGIKVETETPRAMTSPLPVIPPVEGPVPSNAELLGSDSPAPKWHAPMANAPAYTGTADLGGNTAPEWHPPMAKPPQVAASQEEMAEPPGLNDEDGESYDALRASDPTTRHTYATVNGQRFEVKPPTSAPGAGADFSQIYDHFLEQTGDPTKALGLAEHHFQNMQTHTERERSLADAEARQKALEEEWKRTHPDVATQDAWKRLPKGKGGKGGGNPFAPGSKEWEKEEARLSGELKNYQDKHGIWGKEGLGIHVRDLKSSLSAAQSNPNGQQQLQILDKMIRAATGLGVRNQTLQLYSEHLGGWKTRLQNMLSQSKDGKLSPSAWKTVVDTLKENLSTVERQQKEEQSGYDTFTSGSDQYQRHPDLVKRSRVQMFGEDSAPTQSAAPTGDPLIDKYRHLYQQPGGGGQ